MARPHGMIVITGSSSMAHPHGNLVIIGSE